MTGGGALVSKFLRPCGNEDGEFTEVGEESWPVGAWEVVIFGGWWCWWCWSGGKVEIWVRLFWYVGNSKCDAENLLEILSKLMTEMDGYLATSIYSAVFVTACFSAVYNTGGVLQDIQKNSISSAHCLSPSFILNTVPYWRIASCHSVHTSANFWV